MVLGKKGRLDVGARAHIVIELLCSLLKGDVLIKTEAFLAVDEIVIGDDGNVVFLAKRGGDVCRRINDDLKRSHMTLHDLCLFGKRACTHLPADIFSLSFFRAKFNLFL